MPQKSKPTPMDVMYDLWAVWRSQTVVTAMELDLPSQIAAGNRTAKQIGAAIDASEVGTERLLDAMVALGYLNKKNGNYGLEPVSRDFLVRDKPLFMGDLFESNQMLREGWNNLAAIVKAGKPMFDPAVAERAKEFFPKLVAGIFPASFTAATAACKTIASGARGKIKSILDVAAGSAAWSIPFARAFKSARVTVIDFPEVTPVTRRFAEQWGVADRYDYLEGDMHQLDFGTDYDLIILGHILHIESPAGSIGLLKKSYEALKDKGQVLIAEMVPNDTRTGPVFPLLFGLNMLIHTQKGGVYTMREYRDWLGQAGFRKVKTVQAPAPSPLIVATK
ncbi:MAG TPA: methyltransferase [Candidatus Binataceae bacterium]|nr:methyltransferase [Candidatus Binataceae bacterium]